MSKGGTEKTTEETKMDPAVTAAQMNLLGKGQRLTAPFLQTPGYAVAGFNPDQMMGFDLSRILARNAFTGESVRGVPGQASLVEPTAMAQAGNVSGADIQALMNPYIDTVIGTTVDKMRGEYDDTNASIGARMAAAGAYGGSREAVQRAALDESYGEQVASTVAQLMMQGWDQASALALANEQMAQQSDQFNAGNVNRQREFNAGQQNDFALNAPQVESSLASSRQARQLTALQQLLGIGGQQQQFSQNALNVPFDMLGKLAGVVPQQYNQTQTTTQPAQGGGPLGQILGTGLSILGMGTGGAGSSIAGSLFNKFMK